MELPVLSTQGQGLADEVERLVQARTSGLIRGLRVDVQRGEVVLSGRTHTYYAKQLATHAAMDALENRVLTNHIEVD